MLICPNIVPQQLPLGTVQSVHALIGRRRGISAAQVVLLVLICQRPWFYAFNQKGHNKRIRSIFQQLKDTAAVYGFVLGLD